MWAGTRTPTGAAFLLIPCRFWRRAAPHRDPLDPAVAPAFAPTAASAAFAPASSRNRSRWAPYRVTMCSVASDKLQVREGRVWRTGYRLAAN